MREKMRLAYFIDKGTYKEVIRDDKLLFRCPFCGEWFRGLAYHTNQKHGITGKELRRMMNLKSDYQLTTPEIKERHRQITMENRDSHIKTNLLVKGHKTRFKKNCEGHVKSRWSGQAISELKKRKKKQYINLLEGRR